MRSNKIFQILVCSIFLVFSFCHMPAQEQLAEANFNLDNVNYLEIEGGFCNVVLSGHLGSSLKMDAEITGNGDPDKYEIIYRQDNDRIKVWVEHPSRMWGNMNLRGVLEFKVPAGVEILVDNSSGNLNADNLQARKIHLETSSGNINVEKTEAELTVKCSSGNIGLESHNGDVNLKATSGNLKIREVNGDLIANATSGNIQIYDVSGNTSADCSSGNIKMGDIVGELNAGTSSGNIRGESIKLTGDSRFKASSGNITIDLMNDEDELSFDLDAGSGNLRAGGSKADDRLILTKGPIKITGISSSGNQTYSMR